MSQDADEMFPVIERTAHNISALKRRMWIPIGLLGGLIRWVQTNR